MRQHDTYDAALMQYPNLYALLRKIREVYVTHPEMVFASQVPILMWPHGDLPQGDSRYLRIRNVSTLEADEHTLGQELQSIAWMAQYGDITEQELIALDKESTRILESVRILAEKTDQKYVCMLKKANRLN